MNGRKARAMRRAARRMTVGMPSHHLTFPGHSVEVPTGVFDTKGRPLMRYVDISGTAQHAPTCTRAVYQKLKKVYGHARLGVLK